MPVQRFDLFRCAARLVAVAAPAVALAVPVIALAVIASLVLSGCQSDNPDRSGLFEPYRIDMPQGNYVTQEMVQQLTPGMSREQVRFVLGSPLLLQTFRSDRWDYVFRYQHANGRADSRRVAILFKDEKVAKIEADPLPQRDDASDPALPGAKRALARP